VVVTAAADGHYTAGSSLLTAVESETNGPAVIAELLVGVAPSLPPTLPPTATGSGTPDRPEPFMPLALLMGLAAGLAAMFAVRWRGRQVTR
jgi:hypothetical protein